MKKILKHKHEIFLTSLVLFSVYLSLAEALIPKPFPWMKIGLANIATLIALEKFNSKMAFEVVILRVLIQAIMFGTLFTPSFIISLSAGVVSSGITVFFYRFRNYLSMVAISSLSAFIHNIFQLIIVYFLMFRGIELGSKSIYIFIFFFLGLGVISGGLIGIIVEKLSLRRGGDL